MAKILFLLLLSIPGLAQSQFKYLLYVEKTIENKQIKAETKLMETDSYAIVSGSTIDVLTWNWQETLNLERKITKNTYLFRTNSGELVLCSLKRYKAKMFPSQKILMVLYKDREYWFIKKLK